MAPLSRHMKMKIIDKSRGEYGNKVSRDLAKFETIIGERQGNVVRGNV